VLIASPQTLSLTIVGLALINGSVGGWAIGFVARLLSSIRGTVTIVR